MNQQIIIRRCILKIKGGCNFEGRYNYSASNPTEAQLEKLQLEDVSPLELVKVLECFRTKTYLYDICTRCGKISSMESNP